MQPAYLMRIANVPYFNNGITLILCGEASLLLLLTCPY